MPYLKGQKVDPADVHARRPSRFENIDEFKQLLLKDKDQTRPRLDRRSC